MNRFVPVLPLRGSDPTLLEVQLPELLRRPIGQIALVNVMDLIELAVTEGRPKPLDRGLQAFVQGLRRQVADIPKGRSWEQFLDELGELSGTQVPLLFREMLAEEGREPERATARVSALLERWSSEPPEAFPLSTRKARIQRAEMVQPRAPSPEPSTAPRERGERAEGTGRTRTAKEKAPATPRPKPVVDIERRDFVVDQCLERLARTSDKGLAEAVLVAGVRHAAREQYPDMPPIEVTYVLKQLRDANRVRYSAGRWALVTRF
ncbi:MAG: hypothetical protein ABMB14_03520 [Myxococcota bacterium]